MSSNKLEQQLNWYKEPNIIPSNYYINTKMVPYNKSSPNEANSLSSPKCKNPNYNKHVTIETCRNKD